MTDEALLSELRAAQRDRSLPEWVVNLLHRALLELLRADTHRTVATPPTSRIWTAEGTAPYPARWPGAND